MTCVIRTNKTHFSYLTYSNESVPYMFRIEQVFINKRQLLYVQHMVFTVRLQ